MQNPNIPAWSNFRAICVDDDEPCELPFDSNRWGADDMQQREQHRSHKRRGCHRRDRLARPAGILLNYVAVMDNQPVVQTSYEQSAKKSLLEHSRRRAYQRTHAERLPCRGDTSGLHTQKGSRRMTKRQSSRSQRRHRPQPRPPPNAQSKLRGARHRARRGLNREEGPSRRRRKRPCSSAG